MRLDTDRILGVTALIVGVASLAVVVYQTQLERRVQSASVLPYWEKGVVTEGAVLEITYSSVFSEQWVVRSDNIVPATRP